MLNDRHCRWPAAMRFRPRCADLLRRVLGAAGTCAATEPAEAGPREWHRLRCLRRPGLGSNPNGTCIFEYA